MRVQKPKQGPIPIPRVSPKREEKDRKRTPRACDRCRVKKAKCDGRRRCQTCQASDSACMYTARRVREARSFYCQMRESTDQAIQLLYWACRKGKEFPGEVPDESTGEVSTTAILKGLGLVGPDFEGPALPKELRQQSQASSDVEPVPSSLKGKEPEKPVYASSDTSRIQTLLRQKTPHINKDQSGSNQPSPVQSSFGGSQMPSDTSSIITSQLAPPTPSEMDMQEPFAYGSASSISPQQSRRTSKPQGLGIEASCNENPVETSLDLDILWDTSFSAKPVDSQTLLSFCQPGDLGDMPAMNLTRQSPKQQVHHDLRGAVGGDFLPPWPGTSAAAYQAATTG